MRRFTGLLYKAGGAVMVPGAAFAHAGHETGSFMTGLSHPLGGADHVLVMVAVGLWAAQSGGRALWAAPLAFVAAMLAGAAFGITGMAFLTVEPVILASVIILGAAVALAVPVRLALALPFIALFGIAHGWAHGAEAPGAESATYTAGFALATMALHGLGIALGLGLSRGAAQPASRVLGGIAAGAGVVLAMTG